LKLKDRLVEAEGPADHGWLKGLAQAYAQRQ